ncbi:MAG: D-xylose transporter XylE [Flammeovirgaceae bacterium]
MKRNNVLAITLVATLGGLLFGYDTAVINGAIGPMEQYFQLTPEQVGWATGCALVGCVIGSAGAGWLSDVLGRKQALIWSAVLFAVSAIGSAIPESLNEFVFYRIVGGVGVGIASLVAPMYIAEIAPSNQRGELVSYYQLAIVIGILVVFFANYFIAGQGDETWLREKGWRWMLGSETLPALMFLAFLFFVPQSPRWLVQKQKSNEALKVLEKLRSSDIAKQELKEIEVSIRNEQNIQKASILDKGVPWVISIGVIMSFLQQVTGINVIMYYGTEIFKGMGEGTSGALFQTILVGVINLIFTILAIYTIDKWGRKPLVIVGSLGMGLGIFGLAACIYTQSFGIIALVSVLTFIGSFAMSMGPVVWVLLSEIFSNKIRGTAMSIAVAAQWISNFIVTQTFPMMNNNEALKESFNGSFAFWVYGFFCIVTVLFTLKFVPETKGKSLEEMEQVFGIQGSNNK